MHRGDMLRDTGSEPGFDLFEWGRTAFIDETVRLVNADHAPVRLNRSALCQHTYPMVEPVAASSSGSYSALASSGVRAAQHLIWGRGHDAEEYVGRPSLWCRCRQCLRARRRAKAPARRYLRPAWACVWNMKAQVG